MNSVNFKKNEQSELTLRKNSYQHSAICLSKKDKAQRHPYWTFDVGRSMFDVHKFLFRFDRPFFWPAAVLTPGT
jgi:hypothetical protein